jgi:hypothetical protein
MFTQDDNNNDCGDNSNSTDKPTIAGTVKRLA